MACRVIVLLFPACSLSHPVNGGSGPDEFGYLVKADHGAGTGLWIFSQDPVVAEVTGAQVYGDDAVVAVGPVVVSHRFDPYGFR